MMRQVNINKPSCLTCDVANCFIKACSDKWKDFANSEKATSTYKKGTQIIFQGNLVLGIHFISYGKVKVTKSWGGEKEQIIRFAKSGDILGHRGFGSERLKHYPISATSLEETHICFFETESINLLLNKNIKLTNKLLQFYAEELYKTEIRMNIISQKPVRERVAIAIIVLINTFGYERNGYNVIDVRVSRNELADFVSTTRENISKFISEFKQDKLISTDKNKVIINNPTGLNKVANLNGYTLF